MSATLNSYHATALLEALSDLHYIHNEQHLYSFVLNRASDVLKAQGGTFFSVQGEDLYPETSKGVSLTLLREIPFKVKSGISGWCVVNRKPLVIDNAQADNRFNRAVDVITGVRTRSLVCVPVVRKDTVLGVLELVNRVDGVFRDSDLEFITHLARQVAIALENCKLYKETQDLLSYTTSVINSLSGGFISTDLQGIVTRCNHAACRILGIVADDVLGKPLLKALPQYAPFSAILEVTQKHQAPAARQEIELHRADGSSMQIGYTTFLVKNESDVLGAAIIFQDISAIRRSS